MMWILTPKLAIELRREFFDEFAKSHNFNPLVAERWYSVSKKDIEEAVSRFIFVGGLLVTLYLPGWN
jgi:hypothetical protein